MIGLPSGYFLTSWLFKVCLDEAFDFSVHINASTYILASIMTFIVSYLVSNDRFAFWILLNFLVI